MKFLTVRAPLQNSCDVGVGPVGGVQAPRRDSQEVGIQSQKERRSNLTLVSHRLPEDPPPRALIISLVLPCGCSPKPGPVCPQTPVGSGQLAVSVQFCAPSGQIIRQSEHKEHPSQA